MQQILTVKDAATVLRTHPNIIRKLLQQGQLGGFRLGRSWRITPVDLETYIATQGRVSQSERQQWGNLMQAQETALQSVWNNDADEVWNNA